MSEATRIVLNEAPGTLNQYGRALFAKGTKTKNPQLPKTEIILSGVKADPAKVTKYSEVCGFNQKSTALPLTFPHIMAFPLHIELMLQKDFPLALMGLVHIRNEIIQHRPINIQESMDIRCYFTEGRMTDKGFEIDIKSDVTINGELVWEDISTNLARMKTDIPAPAKSKEKKALPSHPFKEAWTLVADLGRRYAGVSGDSNPIHLYPLTAKLFGFKRHIAHGMWTKARTIATLQSQLGSDACRVVVDFKLPVFLPATIELHYDKQDGKIEFDVRDAAGQKPHLAGEISKL